MKNFAGGVASNCLAVWSYIPDSFGGGGGEGGDVRIKVN